MAKRYKLSFFDTTATGEPIRFLLAYGEIDYEDNRFNREEWEASIKATTPIGKAPILEVDGKVLHQHVAICRYLGRKLNLAGKDDWEAAQIDAVVDTISSDLSSNFVALFTAPEEEQPKKLDNLLTNIIPFYFGKFDQQIKENGGYFVGGQLSWADIYFAGLWDQLLKALGKDVLPDYPNLNALKDTVIGIPQIENWIAVRPKK